MRIDVPAGLELVAGELERTVRPAERDPWDILVRATRPGTFTIRGQYQAIDDRHTDEAEWVVRLDVRPDTLIAQLCDRVREERIENGQRYRYGGYDLVPIDGPEDFTHGDVRRQGDRARPVSNLAIECSACALDEPETVSCHVLVAADGRVREVRVPAEAGGQAWAQPMAEAIRQSVSQWTFSPTKVRSKSVPGWTKIDVVVR